jgi:hypothetical protein
MITAQLFENMLAAGAISPSGANFFIIKQQFPAYLEEMIQARLEPLELEIYKAGFIAFVVRPNGRLIWKITPKGLLLGRAIDAILERNKHAN